MLKVCKKKSIVDGVGEKRDELLEESIELLKLYKQAYIFYNVQLGVWT